MIGYINTVKDTAYKQCTCAKFSELIGSPIVKTLIEEYRKGNQAAKQQLPAFLFQGYDPNVLEGKKGSRRASSLLPTGLFMMDFDHVDFPREVYDKFLLSLPDLGVNLETDVALVHVTPSGKGLRIVLKMFDGKSIEDCQKIVSNKLGFACDEVVKDLSRLSFVPSSDDIIYRNNTLLFSAPSLVNLPKVESQPMQIAAEVNGQEAEVKMKVSHFPECLVQNGENIPYKDIVEELIQLYGGEPTIGNRNNVLFRLASDLCKITDYSSAWLESIIPTFGLPAEEWRATIEAQCKKPQESGYSRLLYKAIKRCKQRLKINDRSIQEENGDNRNLPPKLPENLPPIVRHLIKNVMPFQREAVATMVFPALATHVNNASFLLADNKAVELSLMSALLARQSVGKSCINEPTRIIMQSIEAVDDINREREQAWQQEQLNKKANEKGKNRPQGIVIRILGSDTTNAAFLNRLRCAEVGDDKGDNYCTYSQVEEIEDLYNFCSSGGKSQVSQMIRHSWDRDKLSAERFTANAANFKTVLRWNWAACSTIEGGAKFFANMLTNGTASRIDFCTIVPPEGRVKFRYGNYDDAFISELEPYIKKLDEFKCERDNNGRIKPYYSQELIDLEEKMNDYIYEVDDEESSSTYVNYAWRQKVMALKKGIILYIAEGCKMTKEIEDFVWWAFKYGMWCKLNMFADKADEQFVEEAIQTRGHKSPLKMLPQKFVLSEFVAGYTKLGLRGDPYALLRKYISRGLIRKDEECYVISDNFCLKNGIKIDLG